MLDSEEEVMIEASEEAAGHPSFARVLNLGAVVVFVVAVLALVGRVALGQEIHHHDGMTPEVDKFYSTWLKPNEGSERVSICCNKVDCNPAQIERRDGRLYGRRDNETAWHVIPDALIEANQSDPRESPDGRSHICVSYTGTVICAVLGSGQ